MASTRTINTVGDYKVKSREMARIEEYPHFANSSYGTPCASYAIPDIGTYASRTSRTEFTKNAIDIESELRGTGTTNLVNPHQPVIPDPNKIQFKTTFVRPTVVMPKPLVCEKYQRSNW